jgi:hypothetical protein
MQAIRVANFSNDILKLRMYTVLRLLAEKVPLQIVLSADELFGNFLQFFFKILLPLLTYFSL